MGPSCRRANPRPSADVGVQTDTVTITDNTGVSAANYTAALAKVFAFPDVALETYLKMSTLGAYAAS